jgi:nicotinamide-nucleotide amidase
MNFRISLLTIGDELLIGQVLNSNAQWIGEQLTWVGAKLQHHLTVGDREADILDALAFLEPRSDVILIGGGLGPTHDDITLDVLAKFCKTTLVFDSDWIQKVEAYFKSRNRTMSENNKKQAMLLKGATRIDNDCGTAAGQWVQHGRVDFYVFPGVPHEMKSMMNRFVLPKLSERVRSNGQRIYHKTLLTTGMGESALALKCEPFVQKIASMPEMSLAFLPNSSTVRLRLMMATNDKGGTDPEASKAKSQFDSLCEELVGYCGNDFFGFEPETLEGIILNLLRKKGATLALAESCTGGLITHRLTQTPGMSEVLRGALIPYQTQLKTQELDIPQKSFEERGVVSETVAKAMAWSIQRKWNVDYALSTTGYLGPSGGDSFAKVGTVCIGVATPNGILSKTFHYEADRERAKERAAQSALDMLRRQLLGALE